MGKSRYNKFMDSRLLYCHYICRTEHHGYLETLIPQYHGRQYSFWRFKPCFECLRNLGFIRPDVKFQLILEPSCAEMVEF